MRVSSGADRKKRIKKILKQTKGMRSGRRRLLRSAKEAIMRSGQNAYTGRKIKKRDFRSMWIVRINAACELRDIPYHRFMNGLKKASVELNRKALSEVAISDEKAFDVLVDTAKKALA
jgi:large subunit ribosomal protein L20